MMESQANTESSTGQDKYERFESWLRENGAIFDLCELREYKEEGALRKIEEEKKDEIRELRKEEGEESGDSEMRGVYARMNIPPNTICVSVPRKCLITVEMGQATSIGQAVLQSELDLDAPKHIFLMIYLLWDRAVYGSESFFAPYYDILPQTLNNMPIFWSENELSYLEGSYLLEQIADRNEAIAEDYHSICQVAPQLKEIATLEEFKWARMCVCSRNFGLQMDGHRTSALVPHADMLNHCRPRETKWTFDDERQAFTITTLQTIPDGSQVYDSYGQKCNHRFLLNYGFAVENNREMDGYCPNEVPLELSVSKDDPLYSLKLEFWTRGDAGATAASAAAGLVRSEFFLDAIPLMKRIRVCVSNNENTRNLFSMLRALACNEAELRILMSSTASVGYARTSSFLGLSDARVSVGRTCRDIRHPLNLRNERAAMQLLLDTCLAALDKYPTSLGQDISDLLDEDLYPSFSNKRHAKIQVRGEKEVLHHFIIWAKTALRAMQAIHDELYSSTDMGLMHMLHRLEHEHTHATIMRYCCDVLTSLRREELRHLDILRARAAELSQKGGAGNGDDALL
mmetsp:Transcript_6148/g.9340  ORF Transcript_6148/g.9340 Transcript_6148/m.9340 type:complete len:572 (-) Transcript_6148:53-1768(-)